MRPDRTIHLNTRPPLTVATRRPPAAYRPSDPEPVRLPSWVELVRVSPSLLRFEMEAREAGERRFDYWLRWVRAYSDFKTAIHVAAQATGMDFATITRVCLARLESAYDTAAKLKGRR